MKWLTLILSIGMLSGCAVSEDLPPVSITTSVAETAATMVVTDIAPGDSFSYEISPVLLFDDDNDYISGVAESGEFIYALANRTTDKVNEYYLLRLNTEINTVQENGFERDSVAYNANYSHFTHAPDGNFYILKTSYIAGDKTGETTAEYDLIYHDKDLLGFYALDIDKLAEGYADIAVNGVNDMEIDGNGYAYFLIGDTVVAADIKGSFAVFSFSASPEGFHCEQLMPLSDGRVGVFGHIESTQTPKIVPIEVVPGGTDGDDITGYLSDFNTAADGPADIIISTEPGVCYVSDKTAVYTFDLESGTRTKIIDLESSGLADFIFDRIIEESPDTYIISGYNMADNTRGIFRLNPVA
jgi:hypothetical protein